MPVAPCTVVVKGCTLWDLIGNLTHLVTALCIARGCIFSVSLNSWGLGSSSAGTPPWPGWGCCSRSSGGGGDAWPCSACSPPCTWWSWGSELSPGSCSAWPLSPVNFPASVPGFWDVNKGTITIWSGNSTHLEPALSIARGCIIEVCWLLV